MDIANPYGALYSTNTEIEARENALLAAEGVISPSLAIPLAWCLRECASARALALIEQSRNAVTAQDPAHALHLARGLLIEAEISYLHGHLARSETLVQTAIDSFRSIDNGLGLGDCDWLIASICQDTGDRQRHLSALATATLHYQEARDPIRTQASQARALASLAFVNPCSTRSELDALFGSDTPVDQVAATWVNVARANSFGLTDDLARAVRHDIEAFHSAIATFQQRQAVICAANAAEGFANLGDLDTALEWSERSSTLARQTGWPATISASLMQAGDLLRMLKRFNDARQCLDEALAARGTTVTSRGQALTITTLGWLAIDTAEFDEALAWFGQIEHSLHAHGEPDLLLRIHRGQAMALAGLGRGSDALSKIELALSLARSSNHVDEHIKALQACAAVYRQCPQLPTLGSLSAAEAVVHYLTDAVQLAKSTRDLHPSGELLAQLAAAYADIGDYQSAYRYACAAEDARNVARLADAEKKAAAQQIRHEMDRVRADAEHHRNLAHALQETSQTLETLGQIGREITASLDANAVYHALHRHVDQLLPADSFAIYRLNDAGDSLSIGFGVEQGRPHPAVITSMDSATSLVARCVRERREFVLSHQEGDIPVKIIPGTIQTQSMLFAPLEASGRVLGAMTIQSVHEHTYGERERSIFRTLCAYGAIALDNAAAYQAVEEARQEMVRHERELRIAAVAFESQEGMVIADTDNTLLRVNSAFVEMTGYAAHEVLGNPVSMFRSSHSSDEFLGNIQKALKEVGSWQGELWLRKKDGNAIPTWATVTVVKGDEGPGSVVYALLDISDRKQAEDEIRHLAYFDSLTGLPNRRLLSDRLQQALIKSERTEQFGALLFIDLDHFKRLNDTRGHDVGDQLLKQVAERLTSCLRDCDTVARLGGDEFVVLLESLGSDAISAAEGAKLVGEKILEGLDQPYLLEGQEHHTTPSIGANVFRGRRETADELMKQVDLAMYQAKSAGRNTIRFFDPEMQTALSVNAAMEVDLRQAIARDQLVLHYQPQLDVDGVVIGAEALVRWQHPERGIVSPTQFITLAEETGLILPLGQWVLNTACKQLRRWQGNPQEQHLVMAVNISARQFHDANFVADIREVIDRHAVNPKSLKLELTESMLLHDIESVIDKMNALRKIGVTFSLDDFGTGYSSLAYLKRLPISQLKIDRSFVRDIFSDANDRAIVEAIVSLGKSLDLQIVAEGVETAEQYAYLRACKCSAFQGYYFGRPRPIDECFLQSIDVA